MKKLGLGISLLVLIGVTLAGCQSTMPAASPSPPPTPTLIAGQSTYEDLVQVFDYDPQTECVNDIETLISIN